MTAGGHLVLAVSCGLLAGGSNITIGLLAAGAILPDIDHPQSTIGKIFPFFSLPLYHRCGHRKSIHGLPLWTFIAIIGVFYRPLLFIGLGGLSHVFYDCFTLSGVQALMPLSEKICVLFDRKFRILTGSRQEAFLTFIFVLLALGGVYLQQIGGFRAWIGILSGSYQIAVQQFKKKGLQICDLSGELRWSNGETEQASWLIIGTEKNGVALWDRQKKKVVHLPKDGFFLFCHLSCFADRWQAMTIHGWALTKERVFFWDGSRWRVGKKDSVIWGQVLGRRLEFESVDLMKIK